MFRTITCILCFSTVLTLFSCSSDKNSGEATAIDNKNAPAERKEAEYPDLFKEMGALKFEDSFVVQQKRLTNTKGKFGMQTREETDAEFDEVKTFILDSMEQNGWRRDTKRDKQSTPEQENQDVPLKYFVTNFQKDKYFLMINITAASDEKTRITKLMKEM